MLSADNRSRDPKEPDGSAATLWGKINPRSFGDRAQQSKPGEEGDAKKCVRRAAPSGTQSYSFARQGPGAARPLVLAQSLLHIRVSTPRARWMPAPRHHSCSIDALRAPRASPGTAGAPRRPTRTSCVPRRRRVLRWRLAPAADGLAFPSCAPSTTSPAHCAQHALPWNSRTLTLTCLAPHSAASRATC